VHESTFVKRIHNDNMSVKSVTVGFELTREGPTTEVKRYITANNIHTIYIVHCKHVIATFRTTVYRNRWTVSREPMPKRQSEEEYSFL